MERDATGITHSTMNFISLIQVSQKLHFPYFCVFVLVHSTFSQHYNTMLLFRQPASLS